MFSQQKNSKINLNYQIELSNNNISRRITALKDTLKIKK